MPIDISVTIFQMFASILMSLSYFRINSNFLKSCDKTFMKNLNKIKINLLKNILESKNKSKIERLKLLYKIIISLLIIILSIYFILSDIFFNLIEYFNNMLFIFIPFFIYMISLLYFTKKVNDLIIPKANIVILKFYLCMFKLIYLLSKQSFMAGIGFLFLFYSFFFRFNK